jgi:hypothetical protein
MDPQIAEDVTPEQVDAQTLEFANKALAAIEARESEFKKGWWVDAENAEKIYLADKDMREQIPYNILYSNTEVLAPSLYSATPKPDIRSRYRTQDVKPIPEILERFLRVASDPASPGADCLDIAMRDSVLSALIPGMGYVRIRYIEDRAFPISYESGHFKTLLWGKAARWSKVPWVCFAHAMTRKQLFDQFKIPEEDQTGYVPSSETEEDKDNCTVYEFWDKKTRKVYFISNEWQNRVLRSVDDPLGLENFFPTPGIMTLTMRTKNMLPMPLYMYYKEQAEELNRVSVRLNKVLSAIKVRGVYNGLLGDDLKKLLAGDDMENTMLPAAEAGLLAQSGGFEKHIWMLPIERLVEVAKQLYVARESIKQVIYEITGISDIIRGSSVASETATAQDLKNKWGTVRLRRMQTLVADYARDLFRMSVDCGSEYIPPEKWREITQLLEIPTEQEQAVAKQQLVYEQQQVQAQQAQMPPPMPPQPGQPPQAGPPPVKPPDPKLLQAANSPTWEKLLMRIKTDAQRTFLVNIQTSSTIDLDSAQDKSEVQEFMASMGQLLPGLQGFVSLGPTGLEAAKSILMGVCSRFKFGIEITDAISKIEAPPPAPPEQKGPPPPSPEEVQAVKAEAQMKLMKVQGDMAVNKAQTELKLAEVEASKTKLAIDIQEAQLRLEGTRLKLAAQKATPTPAKTPSKVQ